jgi:hypothetical protein
LREKKTKKQLEEEREEDKKAKNLQFIMPVEGKEPETVVFEKKDLPKLLKRSSRMQRLSI